MATSVRSTLLAAHLSHQSPKNHADQSRACAGSSQDRRPGLVARDTHRTRSEIPHAEGDEDNAQSEEERLEAVHWEQNIPIWAALSLRLRPSHIPRT